MSAGRFLQGKKCVTTQAAQQYTVIKLQEKSHRTWGNRQAQFVGDRVHS